MLALSSKAQGQKEQLDRRGQLRTFFIAISSRKNEIDYR